MVVDGNDNVWVSNFAMPASPIVQLCGVRTEHCPPGFKTGEQISPPGGYVGGGLQLQTDIAIGIAGMDPVFSYIGQVDPHGHEFKVQAICTADELTGAAELVKGNVSRVPVAVVRGFEFELDDTAVIAPVLRDQTRDLFR